MQIVINIDEEDYKELLSDKKVIAINTNLQEAIKNGTPLPKGHGRLIDADDLCITTVLGWDEENEPYRYVSAFNLELAPTIIEADAPKRRKGTPLEENDSGYNCENWIP